LKWGVQVNISTSKGHFLDERKKEKNWWGTSLNVSHCLIVTYNICPPHVEIGFHGKKSMSLPFGFGVE